MWIDVGVGAKLAIGRLASDRSTETSMTIRFSCPACRAPVNAPDGAAGRQSRCPKCQTPIQVPALQAAPVPVVPVQPTLPPAPALAPIPQSSSPLPVLDESQPADQIESAKPGRLWIFIIAGLGFGAVLAVLFVFVGLPMLRADKHLSKQASKQELSSILRITWMIPMGWKSLVGTPRYPITWIHHRIRLSG